MYRHPVIDFFHDKFMKITALALAVGAVVVLFTIITHSGHDPSWNNATDNHPSNLFGYFGAWLSDMLLQMFGLAGVITSVLMLMWAFRFYQGRMVSKLWLRLLYSIMALGSAAAVFEAQVGYGGLFGGFLKNQLYLDLTAPIYNTLFIFSFIVLTHLASGLKFREQRELLERLKRPVRKVEGIVKKEKAQSAKRARIRQEPAMGEYIDKIAKPRIVAPAKKMAVAKQASLLLNSDDDYELPPVELLKEVPTRIMNARMSETALSQNAKILEGVLGDFSIKGDITKISPGPVVTLYEFQPAAGTKSSRVIGLSDDIARSMSSVSARISTVPGQNVLGIELPNSKRETVMFREMLESGEYRESTAKLPLALGKDIGGAPVVVDLAKMPHLLVAGTTGSGKSVAINTMIVSLLYKLSPSQCKFIMIDPKMLELSVYDGIPHLLAPVVTEPGKAIVALKWVVREMENRYRLMSTLGVRNLDGYNTRVEEAANRGEELTRNIQTGFDPETGKPIIESIPIGKDKFPYIVVIVDEMADLMLVAGKDIETSIQRLAQMARAAGIHIIMATQRPSVDVITGVIKANFPTRISFQVTSKIDSRTILGEQGAEQLLGMGDMLYMAGGGRISRVHGPYVEDREVEKVVGFLKKQGAPAYIEDITREEEPLDDDGMIEGGEGGDDASLYNQAVQIVIRDKKASTSYVQRRLRIGYNRAALLIEQMEEEGVISAPNHAGKREILVDHRAA